MEFVSRLVCALLVLLMLQQCHAQNSLNCSAIDPAAFTPYVLKNARGHEATFIRFGGTITHFLVPDKDGVRRDVVLGFDDATQYCANAIHPYFGAIIGRYANRIANGTFELNGKTYHTPLNDKNWDTLHGGTIGFDRRVWDVVYNTSSTLALSYFSPDGEMGFPGNLWVNTTYTLNDEGMWIIYYSAKSDQDTVINLSQHTYWNFNGFADDTQDVLDHTLFINANQYAEVDSHLIPTGVLGNVSEAYWLDFSHAKLVGKDIANGTVAPGGGYDNAYVLDREKLKYPAVTVSSNLTGIQMDLYTNQVSVQFYSGNFLDGTLPRKQDQSFGPTPQFYEHWSAVVFEAQAIPNSLNEPQWPTTTLKAGEIYDKLSVYHVRAQE